MVEEFNWKNNARITAIRETTSKAISVTQNAKTYIQGRGNPSCWVMKWDVYAEAHPTASKICAFLEDHSGTCEPFLLHDLELCHTKTFYSDTIYVKSLVTQGRTIWLENIPVGKTVLYGGEFVKFSGHSKIYKVKDDVIGDQNGEASIRINCPLISAVSSGEQMLTNDFSFQVFIKSDIEYAPRIDASRDNNYVVEYLDIDLMEFV
jgi:hypothetical protein